MQEANKHGSSTPSGVRRVRITEPATDRPMASLVLGHSHDPARQEALRVAADLARRMYAHLHVVHAIDLGDYPIDPDALDWEEQAACALAEEHEQVRTALASVPAGWTYHASRGDPVALISLQAPYPAANRVVFPQPAVAQIQQPTFGRLGAQLLLLRPQLTGLQQPPHSHRHEGVVRMPSCGSEQRGRIHELRSASPPGGTRTPDTP
jgi:hypothetical protein